MYVDNPRKRGSVRTAVPLVSVVTTTYAEGKCDCHIAMSVTWAFAPPAYIDGVILNGHFIIYFILQYIVEKLLQVISHVSDRQLQKDAPLTLLHWDVHFPSFFLPKVPVLSEVWWYSSRISI